MAYALVGTAGTAVLGTSGASVSPTFGTGESRTAGNLLLCFCSGIGSITFVNTPSGWSVGIQGSGSSNYVAVFYKIAAGGDAAPTLGPTTGSTIGAQLMEFSGNQTSGNVVEGVSNNAKGTNNTSSSPVTSTNAQTDTVSGVLLCGVSADFRSAARAPNDTFTSNSGTVTQAGSNNGTSIATHYSFGYVLATTQNAAADTMTMTASVTTSITGILVGTVSFRLPPPAVLPEFVTLPLKPPHDPA